MSKALVRLTPHDVARQVFPDADLLTADHLLWNHTPYPCVPFWPSGNDHYRRQLTESKLAFEQGQSVCDFCPTAIPRVQGMWLCDSCREAMEAP